MLLCAALESLQQYGTVTFISLHANHGAKKKIPSKKGICPLLAVRGAGGF